MLKKHEVLQEAKRNFNLFLEQILSNKMVFDFEHLGVFVSVKSPGVSYLKIGACYFFDYIKFKSGRDYNFSNIKKRDFVEFFVKNTLSCLDMYYSKSKVFNLFSIFRNSIRFLHENYSNKNLIKVVFPSIVKVLNPGVNKIIYKGNGFLKIRKNKKIQLHKSHAIKNNFDIIFNFKGSLNKTCIEKSNLGFKIFAIMFNLLKNKQRNNYQREDKISSIFLRKNDRKYFLYDNNPRSIVLDINEDQKMLEKIEFILNIFFSEPESDKEKIQKSMVETVVCAMHWFNKSNYESLNYDSMTYLGICLDILSGGNKEVGIKDYLTKITPMLFCSDVINGKGRFNERCSNNNCHCKGNLRVVDNIYLDARNNILHGSKGNMMVDYTYDEIVGLMMAKESLIAAIDMIVNFDNAQNLTIQIFNKKMKNFLYILSS